MIAESGSVTAVLRPVSMTPRAKEPIATGGLPVSSTRTRPSREALSTSGAISRMVPASACDAPAGVTATGWPTFRPGSSTSATSASSSTAPSAMIRNSGSDAAMAAVPPSLALRRLTMPPRGALISVRPSLTSMSRPCAFAKARSAVAMASA